MEGAYSKFCTITNVSLTSGVQTLFGIQKLYVCMLYNSGQKAICMHTIIEHTVIVHCDR